MAKNRHMVLLGTILLGALLVTGCGGGEAKNGDTIKVQYKGTLEDGTIFDTSVGREPLEFILGDGKLIPGFEQAVVGMHVGELKTVTIPADEAYGPPRDDLVMTVERSQLPEGLEPEVGQQLDWRQEDGRIILVAVTDVDETTITIDANHPLAGKNLTFEIEIVEIE